MLGSFSGSGGGGRCRPPPPDPRAPDAGEDYSALANLFPTPPVALTQCPPQTPTGRASRRDPQSALVLWMSGIIDVPLTTRLADRATLPFRLFQAGRCYASARASCGTTRSRLADPRSHAIRSAHPRQHLSHGFGNFCHVIRAPAGRLTKSLASVRPSGYEAGSAILLYLPPYSPDLNPIESAQGGQGRRIIPKLIEEGICKLSSRGGCGRVVTTRGWTSDI
jgi:hypothetical protein